MNERKVRAHRIGLILTLFVMMSGFLVYRLAEIQFFYLYTQEIAEIKERQINLFNPPPRRADILDRNGELLAVSVETFSLYASRVNFLTFNSPSNSERLLDYLRGQNKLKKQVREQLTDPKRKTLRLAENLTPQEAEYIRRLRLNGIWLDTEYTRYYPASEITAQLIGFVDKDNRGLEGLELLYDKQLSSDSRKERLLRDGRGRAIKILANLDTDAAPKGAMQLSLDLQLQYMAYHHLAKGVRNSNAISGNLITLDIHTGEVYAMAQYPSFNPNNRKRLDVNVVRNRVFSDVFEPGSTLKPIILGAILEQKRFPPNYRVDTSPGYIKQDELVIRDNQDLGKLSLDEVIARSSNVGMVKLSQQVKSHLLLRTLYRLGLGRRTGSLFPGEREGYLPIKPLSALDQATLAYGYGLSVTPIQLAKAYGVLANGGKDFYVNFIKDAKEEKMPVFEEEISDRVMQALKVAVLEGATGRAAGVAGYEVAGKTGTTRKSSSGGGYAENKYLATFVGVAPSNEPRFVTLVVLDEPQGNRYYGGEAAAPVFAAYTRDLFRIYGIVPQRDNI